MSQSNFEYPLLGTINGLRFGLLGEDVVAAANRSFSLAGFFLSLMNGNVGIGTATPGSLFTVGLDQFQVASTGITTIGKAGGTTGKINLVGTTSGVVSLTTKAAAGTWILTLPDTDGAPGEYLQTDGSGVTSWASGSSFALTNGSGTTANGTAVDLGGGLSGNAIIDLNALYLAIGTGDGTLRINDASLAAASNNYVWTLVNNTTGEGIWQPTPAGAQSTYTPTLFNTTNVAASTAYATHYVQVGEWVHVWGEVDIDATSATTLTEMGMEIPIVSALSQTYDLAGTASFEDNTVVQIKADVVNGRAKWRFTPQSNTNNKYSFHFSYRYYAP